MHEILSVKAWALEKSFFQRTSQMILHRLAHGRDLNFLKSIGTNNPESLHTDTAGGERSVTEKPLQISAGIMMEWDSDIRSYVYETEEGQRIARIPMIGSLTKHGGLCSYGSKHLAEKVMAADSHKKIDAHLVYADGPGGSVSGTTELGLAIRNAEKPVITFVDEMAASAHYWVSSQSDYIVGNINEYTEVGSIGVLCVLMNEREWLAKEGLDVRIMRADQSEDKAVLNGIEEWPEEALNQLQQELNVIADDFIQAVKMGRGNRLEAEDENIFSGKMYELGEAIKLGMIDYSGTITDAIELAADVAKSRQRLVTN